MLFSGLSGLGDPGLLVNESPGAWADAVQPGGRVQLATVLRDRGGASRR